MEKVRNVNALPLPDIGKIELHHKRNAANTAIELVRTNTPVLVQIEEQLTEYLGSSLKTIGMVLSLLCMAGGLGISPWLFIGSAFFAYMVYERREAEKAVRSNLAEVTAHLYNSHLTWLSNGLSSELFDRLLRLGRREGGHGLESNLSEDEAYRLWWNDLMQEMEGGTRVALNMEQPPRRGIG